MNFHLFICNAINQHFGKLHVKLVIASTRFLKKHLNEIIITHAKCLTIALIIEIELKSLAKKVK